MAVDEVGQVTEGKSQRLALNWDLILRGVGSWWRVLSWEVSQSHLHQGRILHSNSLERIMDGKRSAFPGKWS